MPRVATERATLTLAKLCLAATCAVAPGCGKKSVDPGPALQIVGESVRFRSEDPVPAASPWFDGQRVRVVAARGEVIGLQVRHRGGGPVTLAIDGAEVAGFEVQPARVARPSTSMYGGSHGAGVYGDGLVAATAPASDPAYFEIRSQAAGAHAGSLVVGGRSVPVELTVVDVALPPLPVRAWAYYDPRELGGSVAEPVAAERACIAMFRERGVLLSPDMAASAYAARAELLGDAPVVPALLPDDVGQVAAEVTAWDRAVAGTDRRPFAIPIDEPHTAEARARVKALGDAVHAAVPAGHFLMAVTDDPRAEYGASVDLYITVHPRLADAFERWTYNGAPPHAGSMVLDAESPGTRTWGWLGWRYRIPIWYAWDALYWHDRHNAKKRKVAAPALDIARDAVSFDDGDDRGNLDGVLALPGAGATPCLPTLRLAALRRGLQDRALLELASHCDAAATLRIYDALIGPALGDVPDSARAAWPRDEAPWESARRQLLELAARCAH